MSKKKTVIRWLDTPEDHDYPAAKSYLSLIYDENFVNNTIAQLKNAPMSSFKAKDIFRASGLSLLGISNVYVKKDQRKIEEGLVLSPLLPLREPKLGKVIIADGYHRLCAVYSFDEDAIIPCKIV